MILLKLFLEFIKIGTFSFGGGFATLPYIYELSKTTNWFSLEEVNKMVTISQMTPGPLACNMATYVGMKLCGIIGSLIATVSFIIPAVVFMTIIYNLISKIQNNKKVENVLKTIRASAYASILASCTIILKMTYLKESGINLKSILLMIILALAMKRIKIHTIWYMIICGLVGILFSVGG